MPGAIIIQQRAALDNDIGARHIRFSCSRYRKYFSRITGDEPTARYSDLLFIRQRIRLLYKSSRHDTCAAQQPRSAVASTVLVVAVRLVFFLSVSPIFFHRITQFLDGGKWTVCLRHKSREMF
jgi:hypothetical protein